MMFSSDPIVDAMRHDMEIEREQEKLPVCDACGQTIDDDRFWRINGETLCDDQELVFIGKIKQCIVEQHHSVLVLLQQLYEPCLVYGSIDVILTSL